MRSSPYLLSALVAVPLGAQEAVIPSTAAAYDANSGMLVPGSAMDSRWQLVVDGELLTQALAGRSLTGLAFRRDRAAMHAFAPGSAHVSVTLSVASTSAVEISPRFDDNHDPASTGRVVVHQGLVGIPASASPAGRTVAWSDPQDVVSIDFTTPFVHPGGPLCIEVVSRRTPGSECPFWAIDATADAASGSVSRIGTACGPFGALTANGEYSTARISPLELVPGATATFVGWGNPGATAAFTLGFVPIDVDLGMFGVGGSGCHLRVDGVVNVFDVFQGGNPLPGGLAHVRLRIPTDPNMLGAAFLTQFLEFGTPIYTSEALQCRIAGGLPTLGMAFVVAEYDGVHLPAVGTVWTDRAPVIRLRFQ